MGRLLYGTGYSRMTFSDVLRFEQRLERSDGIRYRTYGVRKVQIEENVVAKS